MNATKTFHSIAIAGAGSGKTYSLVENYISALFGLDESGQKKRPHELLALTFTQKAANEMRIRIAQRLSDFLFDQTQQEEARKILRALPNAAIGTFHGFCSMLLKEYSLLIAINSDFEILFPELERELATNILRPIIMAKLESNNKIITSLVARFRFGNGRQSLGLIDAILQVYFTLFENGINMHDVEREINSRKINKLELEINLKEIEEAFNYFRNIKNTPKTAERLKIIWECFLQFKQAFDTDEQSVALAFGRLRQSMSGNFGEKSARKNLVEKTVLIGAHLVDFFVAEDAGVICEIIYEFHGKFTEFKSSNSYMSFTDLLLKTRDKLIENHEFRKQVKHRFKHILVDEYQDTSPLQEDLIALIAEDKNLESPVLSNLRPIDCLSFRGGASLFVVGDKKQSIYGFRGADTQIFDRMVQKMQSTGVEGHSFIKRLLTTNRRSKSKILQIINLVSRYSLAEQGYQNDEDLHAFNIDDMGLCEVWINDDDSDDDKDKTLSNLNCAAFGVHQLLQNRDDLRLSDIAILVRRIKSGIVIKKKLKDLGVSSRIVGGEGFFQQLEIVEIICALKLINDPGHQWASAVVFRSALILLSDNQILNLATMGDEKKEISLLRAMNFFAHRDNADDNYIRFQNFMTCYEKIKSGLAKYSLAWALDILIDGCDYAFALGLKNQGDQAYANINKLREMLINKNKNPFSQIDELFENIKNNSAEPLAQSEDADDRVTIMTIHQSKGLEFKVVVVADSESRLPNNSASFLFSYDLGMGVSPRGRPIASCLPQSAEEKISFPTKFDRIKNIRANSEQHEMARLLYVALTRAKEELYITSSKQGYDKRDKSNNILGLFFRAQLGAPKDFLNLCTLRNIKASQAATELLTKKAEKQSLNLLSFTPKPSGSRLSCSLLSAENHEDFAFVITRNFGSYQKNIDGGLAHKVLANAGQILPSYDSKDHDQNHRLIDACLRSESGVHKLNKQKLAKTLLAIKQTLLILEPIFRQAKQVIFEMPIVAKTKIDVVVEGFADLFIEFADFVAVVEFKSSLRAATHPNTYLQLFAYAQGLKTRFDKPIKFAVLLIGSSKTIIFKDYDELCQNLLDHAVMSHISRANLLLAKQC